MPKHITRLLWCVQSNIIFAMKILSVLPSSSVVRPSVRPRPPPTQKIALLQSFLSLKRYPLPPPGGARQYPRSGYFLVTYIHSKTCPLWFQTRASITYIHKPVPYDFKRGPWHFKIGKNHLPSMQNKRVSCAHKRLCCQPWCSWWSQSPKLTVDYHKNVFYSLIFSNIWEIFCKMVFVPPQFYLDDFCWKPAGTKQTIGLYKLSSYFHETPNWSEENFLYSGNDKMIPKVKRKQRPSGKSNINILFSLKWIYPRKA